MATAGLTAPAVPRASRSLRGGGASREGAGLRQHLRLGDPREPLYPPPSRHHLSVRGGQARSPAVSLYEPELWKLRDTVPREGLSPFLRCRLVFCPPSSPRPAAPGGRAQAAGTGSHVAPESLAHGHNLVTSAEKVNGSNCTEAPM